MSPCPRSVFILNKDEGNGRYGEGENEESAINSLLEAVIVQALCGFAYKEFFQEA